MSKPTKAAVIGVGQMGKNHARIYSELPGVELVAIADANQQIAQQISLQYNTKAYQNSEDLLKNEQPDIVSIAVPTTLHHTVAAQAIGHSCHVLIEKPITSNEAKAQDLIDRAKSAGVKLMIGHLERFNPAIRELRKRLLRNELGQIYYLETHRLGPPPAQQISTGVTLDIAVHDLDLIQFVTGRNIEQINASVRHFQHNEHEDWMHSTLTTNGNITASVNCSWLSPVKVRELSVVGAKGLFHVNLLTQDLSHSEVRMQPQQGWEMLSVLQGHAEGQLTKFSLDKQEPLRAEIESFIDSIRENTKTPIPGEDGLNIIRIANAILRSAAEETTVTLIKEDSSAEKTSKVNYAA